MAAHRGDPALGLLMVRRSRRSRKGTAAAPADPRGGAEETRTPDVLLAKEVLYQLSYGPEAVRSEAGSQGDYRSRRTLVGVSGLEPEASALSGQCSNQLS